jgi:hypothetical protein
VYEAFSGEFLTRDNVLLHYKGNQTHVTIPTGVKEISEGAFNGKSIVTITIPSGVESIHPRAFYLLDNLNEISVIASSQHYTSVNGVLYTYDKKTLVKYPSARAGATYDIDAACETVGDYAFMRARNLTSINIHRSISVIGQYAFLDCDNLEAINVSVGIISSYAFFSCDKLENIQIAPGLTEIRNRAFAGCASIQSLELPDSLITIGVYAFENNTGLKSVSIGYNISTIENFAFFNCINLESLRINNETPPEIGQDALKYTLGLNYLILPKLVVYVPDSGVDDYKAAEGWSEIADYIISVEEAE